MKKIAIILGSILVGFVLLVSMLVSVRIGLYFLEPKPTVRRVTTNDVVGVWSLTENGGNTETTMTFNPSGVFTQQISTATPGIHVGRWSLYNSADLRLDGLLMKWNDDWKSGHVTWKFINGDQRLVLFGGTSDPDDYMPLKYLGQIP